MKLTPGLEKAIARAAILHNGQQRKDGTPYVTHLFSVATILSEYTTDEDILVAGLMHDTLEDVEGYTHIQLEEEFGPRVAQIVEGVTEEKWRSRKDLPREEQVKLFEEMLDRNVEKMDKVGAGSVLVTAADKIHNLGSMLEGIKAEGEAYIERFRSNPEQKLRLYRRIEVLVRKYYPNLDLADRLGTLITEAERVFPRRV